MSAAFESIRYGIYETKWDVIKNIEEVYKLSSQCNEKLKENVNHSNIN